MEYLPAYETLSYWLLHYGSFSIFLLLALGIIALPIPEETLMVVAGVLMRNGLLDITPTILWAWAGSVCGITVSYLIGRTLGVYFLHQYGKWIGVTENRLARAHNWFERFGKWTLPIGYFIPGVRHFTGICAGTTYLEYHHFALFAYTGAALWVATFLSIGYFFGNYWLSVLKNIHFRVDDLLTITLAVLLIGYIAYRLMKRR